MSSSRVVRGARAVARTVFIVGAGHDRSESSGAGGASDEEVARAQAAAEAAERERLRQVAHDQGYADGRARAERETRDELQRLGALIDGTVQTYTAAVAAAESQLIELSLAVGEKLARTQLQVGSAALQTLARSALEHIGDATQVAVHVHPDDRDRLGADDDLVAAAGGAVTVTITEDASLEPGAGCVIATELGTIDPRIDVQLEAVAAELLGRGDDAAVD